MSEDHGRSCPKCRRDVIDAGDRCPHCGALLSKTNNALRILSSIVLVIIGLGMLLFGACFVFLGTAFDTKSFWGSDGTVQFILGGVLLLTGGIFALRTVANGIKPTYYRPLLLLFGLGLLYIGISAFSQLPIFAAYIVSVPVAAFFLIRFVLRKMRNE